jgi:hypothetical protein
MPESNEFVLDRSIPTRAAQVVIAPLWIWGELTLLQWDQKIEAFQDQKVVVSEKEAIKTADAGVLDLKLDRLHDRTQVGLSLFKNKHRNNPAMVHALKPLTASGGSRGNILEEALSFEAVWERWDADWSPKPLETLESFTDLREEAESLRKPYAASKAVWRNEVGIWNILGADLNDNCVAWYAAATEVFKEGTAEGDMIRGTIPTTYDALPVPDQAQITDEEADISGRLWIEFDAGHASRFNVWRKGPMDADFLLVAEDVTEHTFETNGLAAGLYLVKVAGKNSKGIGPESDPVTIAVI